MRLPTLALVAIILILTAPADAGPGRKAGGKLWGIDKKEIKAWVDRAYRGEFDSERYSHAEIERGLLWLVDKMPTHQVNTDLVWRAEMVDVFYRGGEQYGKPQLLLLGMGYRESEFYPEVRGKAGELGVLQVGWEGRLACNEVCGGMKTLDEQVMCGACWLDAGVGWCGTLLKGVKAYLAGRCKLKTGRHKWALRVRYKLWAAMHIRIRDMTETAGLLTE